MQRVLLTGAGGFIGRALATALPVPPDVLAMAPPGWEERLKVPLEKLADQCLEKLLKKEQRCNDGCGLRVRIADGVQALRATGDGK